MTPNRTRLTCHTTRRLGQVKDWQGNAVPLSKYQASAKVAIVVNVASK